MKYPVLFCIAFMLCICTPKESFADKEFRYPGQELNGTWQVIKNDFYLKGDNEIFLPIGQKIAFWMTGNFGGYNMLQDPQTGMEIGMKLIFPIDNGVCKLNAWDFLCDSSGKVNLNHLINQKGIKDDGYIVTNDSQGLLNTAFMKAKEVVIFKKDWSMNIKSYYYYLDMNGGSHSYSIYPIKNGDEIFLFGPGGLPALLKRVK